MTMHYGAGPRAGIAQAAPAPHPAGRVASRPGPWVRRPAGETAAALPANPFALRPRLRGLGYLGLGVPAVLAGFGVVHGGGLIDTARYYGAAVIALAALALFGLLKNVPGRAAEPAAAARGIR